MRQLGIKAAAAAVFALSCLGFATPASGQSYNLTPLGGNGSLRAYSINATGQSVGVSVDGDVTHGVRWQNEVFTDIQETVHFRLQHPELFNDNYSEAFSISDGGQIVGGAQKVIQCPNVTGDITVMHAYLLRPSVFSDFGTAVPGDALTDFYTFGDMCDDLDSAATAISNRSHIVGWSDANGSTAIHAFLIVPSGGFVGGMIDLLTLDASADPVSSASAVNDAGQITGYSYTTHTANGEHGFHAFVIAPQDTNADGVGDNWVVTTTPGVNDLMVDIGTLGGTNSWGRDINNDGVIVGESDTAPDADGNHATHAFMWQNGQMTDLGTLGGENSSAAAINDKGDVVGWSEGTDGRRRAFVYTGGKMIDLNAQLILMDAEGKTLVQTVFLAEARSINSDGVIVGWGTAPTDPSGPTKAFMLRPGVPPVIVPADPTDSTGNSDITNGSGTPGGTPIVGTWQTPADGATAGTAVGGETVSDPNANSSANPTAGLCGTGAAGLLPLIGGGLWMLRRQRCR